MPPRSSIFIFTSTAGAASVVLLFALAGCGKPATAERAVDFSTPANRPVATLGPDDAVPSANDTAEPTPAATRPTPTSAMANASPPPAAQAPAKSGATLFEPASVTSGPSTSPSLAPPAAPSGNPDIISADQMKRAIDTAGKVAVRIDFGSDSESGRTMLRADAGALIDEIATLLRDDPALRLSIDDHTDASGGTGDRQLSQQRAETVRASLLAKGIDADRLQARGFGADRPLADNASVEGRARNRRVELVRLD